MIDKFKIELTETNKIIPYENNTKIHPDAQIKLIADSIEKFNFDQPIVVDEDFIVIKGHGRLLAAQHLKLDKVPVIIRTDLTEAQKIASRIADNKSNESDWDFPLLNIELEELNDLDFDYDFGFDILRPEDCEDEKPVFEKGKLTEKYLMPPFSIIDSRKGKWQERKRWWKTLNIEGQKGRDAECLQTSIDEKYGRKQMTGTSIFDPFLAELCYKWFNIDKGKILDPFAGGATRGVVASMLDYDYTGIDLRAEQVDVNIIKGKELNSSAKWICDDSLNIDKHIDNDSIDMIFTCPPYADLEVYSDLDNDISNMDYDNFIEVYTEIIKKTLSKLKENRFAVFVVGDIRDKKGFYRNFIDDTKRAFNNNGALTYNEIIYIQSLGTAAIRAGRPFKSGRKVVKVHENVLVFYKGNPKDISKYYKEIEVMDISELVDEV